MEDMHDGILESWVKIGDCIWGTIYYDSKGRFPDGTEIRTSMVVDREGLIVKTLNSTYVLGQEMEADLDD